MALQNERCRGQSGVGVGVGVGGDRLESETACFGYYEICKCTEKQSTTSTEDHYQNVATPFEILADEIAL